MSGMNSNFTNGSSNSYNDRYSSSDSDGEDVWCMKITPDCSDAESDEDSSTEDLFLSGDKLIFTDPTTSTGTSKSKKHGGGESRSESTSSKSITSESTMLSTLMSLGRFLPFPAGMWPSNENKATKDSSAAKSQKSKPKKPQTTTSEKKTPKKKRTATEVWTNPERRVKSKSKSASRRSRLESQAIADELPSTSEKVTSLGKGPRARKMEARGAKATTKKIYDDSMDMKALCAMACTYSLAAAMTVYGIKENFGREHSSTQCLYNILGYSIISFPFALAACVVRFARR